MSNSNSDNDPVFPNNPSSSEVVHFQFGLDYDDEEFRAGYPFPDISDMDLEEGWKSFDWSSAFDNNDNQFNNSGTDSYFSAAEEQEEIIDSLSQQHEYNVNAQFEPYLTKEYCEDQETNSNQQNDYSEEQNGSYQYVSMDQEKEMNVEESVN